MRHIFPDMNPYLDLSRVRGLLDVRYIGTEQFSAAKEKDHFRQPVPRSIKGSQQIGTSFVHKDAVNVSAK